MMCSACIMAGCSLGSGMRDFASDADVLCDCQQAQVDMNSTWHLLYPTGAPYSRTLKGDQTTSSGPETEQPNTFRRVLQAPNKLAAPTCLHRRFTTLLAAQWIIPGTKILCLIQGLINIAIIEIDYAYAKLRFVEHAQTQPHHGEVHAALRQYIMMRQPYDRGTAHCGVVRRLTKTTEMWHRSSSCA